MFFLPKLSLLDRREKIATCFSGLDLRSCAAEDTLADCAGISVSHQKGLSVYPPLLEKSDAPGAERSFWNVGKALLQAFGGTPVSCLFRFINAVGLESQWSFSLQGNEKPLGAVLFRGELILLCRNGADYSLICYSENGVRKQKVDLTSLLKSQTEESASIFTFAGRIAVVKGRTLHVGYLNAVDKWEAYLGEDGVDPRAAVKLVFEDGGDFTGAVNYGAAPVLFKRDALYLFQYQESMYTVNKFADVGCINPDSIAICNNRLYFLSGEGVMSFDGKNLRPVSEQCPNFAKELRQSKACADGSCYYIGNYVYDAECQAWSRLCALPEGERLDAKGVYRDAVFFVKTTTGGKRIFSYTPFSAPASMPSSSQAVLPAKEWYFTTQKLRESDRMRVEKISLRLEEKQEGTVRIAYAADDQAWQTVYEETVAGSKTITVSLNLPPCDSFRLKISGTGAAFIPYLKRICRIVPDNKLHPLFL